MREAVKWMVSTKRIVILCAPVRAGACVPVFRVIVAAQQRQLLVDVCIPAILPPHSNQHFFHITLHHTYST